ncbi:TorF family putative porin [Ramlibacter sp. MAHUQ-53]|uniref:TorF family putative porin n=1 Tax=unclassified Ramlibacter TaxID=2617605 RepID=UPI003644EDC2
MKLKATVLLSTLALSGAVFAQTKAPEPDYTLSFNAGVVTDYRYRGISQTRLKPAVQAGADLGHSSGLYLGTWATNIKWIKDSGATDGSIELDIYGGYKGTAGDIGYDVGFLRYEYVGNKLGNVPGFANANTNELYAAVTVGPFTAKYSHSVSNLFGYLDSKNSQYLDINATFDLGGGWTVTPHVGRQVIKNNEAYNYTDYSVTLGKDLGNGLSASLMLVDTTAKEALYTWGGKYVGKAGAVAGVKYSF